MQADSVAYVAPQGSGGRLERHEIPGGDAGIEATIVHMRRVAREGARDPAVLELAARLEGATATGAAQRIRGFLSRSVHFRDDPPGLELVRTPGYMLQELEERGRIEGDCDDVAVLGAALGMAAGMRAQYVLVGFSPAAPWSHVYAELIPPGLPAVELDTTRPAQMPRGAVQRLDFREV